MDKPNPERGQISKGRGLRLSVRYARLLAMFVVWAGAGIAVLMFSAQQWFFGGLLTMICVASAAMAIDGRLLKERVHTKFDLITQWLAMVSPVVFVSALLVALGRTLLRSLVPYAQIYILGIMVVLVLAFVELRKGARE